MIFVIASFVLVPCTHALTIDELQKGIEQKSAEIAKLQEQKKKFQDELKKNQKRSGTLKQEIANIDGSIRNLSNNIALALRKIERTQLQIQQLASEIAQKKWPKKYFLTQ